MSTCTSQYESLPGFSPPSTIGPHTAADYWELPEGEPVELILTNDNLIFLSIEKGVLKSNRSATTATPRPGCQN